MKNLAGENPEKDIYTYTIGKMTDIVNYKNYLTLKINYLTKIKLVF